VIAMSLGRHNIGPKTKCIQKAGGRVRIVRWGREAQNARSHRDIEGVEGFGGEASRLKGS